MTVVLVEGFDHMAASQLTWKQWSANPSSMATGRIGAQAARLNSATTITKLLPSTYGTVIAGIAFKLNLTAANVRRNMLRFSTATGALVAAVIYDSVSGKLQVLNAAGSVVATGTTVIASGSWYYAELKIVVGTSGTYELHLNGAVEIASATGNFGTTNIGRVDIQGSDSVNLNANTDLDDIYVLDGTTTIVAGDNTFLGDLAVETLRPNGDGAHTDWLPDTGTVHYSRVNDTTPDGDSSFVSDLTVGHRDSYTFEDLTTLTGTVFAVQTVLYARKDNTGTRQICAVSRPGTTDHDGATDTLGTSYGFFTEILENNPDTSAPWAISEVNAAEFGIKVVT